jgi:hypothetical protein
MPAMEETLVAAPCDPSRGDDGSRELTYAPPEFTVIPLDCEITAYAPDGDDPLF